MKVNSNYEDINKSEDEPARNISNLSDNDADFDGSSLRKTNRRHIRDPVLVDRDKGINGFNNETFKTQDETSGQLSANSMLSKELTPNYNIGNISNNNNCS